MARASASATPRTKRQQYSEATRDTLVRVAERLFAEHGYAATSLDAVVAGADVTKGALYHHFSGKQAIFEAVFDRVDARASREVQEAVSDIADPWQAAQTGLRTFLAIVQQPAYRRVVIQDGPAVVGYDVFRDQEGRSTFGVVHGVVRTVLEVGGWADDEEMIRTFTRIFFGALSAAGASVATSDRPGEAAARVESAIALILAGLESLASRGAGLPDPVVD